MLLKNRFFTIDKNYGPEEIKEKGSRFISYSFHITSKEEATSIIKNLNKKYHDATHVCFAYRLGNGKELYFRYNDNGEPGGTAGLPIYKEIKANDYYNVLIAVIRYYGGVKLGTGGLTRAYAQSARKILDSSKKIAVLIRRSASIFFPFDFTGEIMQIINHYSIKIYKQNYLSDGVNMILSIPEEIFNEIDKIVSDKSKGKVKLKHK